MEIKLANKLSSFSLPILKLSAWGKFKQEFSEVLSEFKEIATNSLLFEDGHVDSCMEKL